MLQESSFLVDAQLAESKNARVCTNATHATSRAQRSVQRRAGSRAQLSAATRRVHPPSQPPPMHCSPRGSVPILGQRPNAERSGRTSGEPTQSPPHPAGAFLKWKASFLSTHPASPPPSAGLQDAPHCAHGGFCVPAPNPAGAPPPP